VVDFWDTRRTKEEAMNGYGAVADRPKGGVVAGAVGGVVLLAAVIGGIIYYQSAERRRLDAMDYDTLAAEYDALAAVAEPLKRLETLAVPDTKPADYATALSDAKTAYERYVTPPRRTTPLPSGRAWPGQFAAADKLAKDSLDHFAMLPYYLDQRAKAKPTKVGGTTGIDTDIENVANMGTTPLHALLDALDRMKTQHDSHAWDYAAAPKTSF
jgi:hypothetical protein